MNEKFVTYLTEAGRGRPKKGSETNKMSKYDDSAKSEGVREFTLYYIVSEEGKKVKKGSVKTKPINQDKLKEEKKKLKDSLQKKFGYDFDVEVYDQFDRPAEEFGGRDSDVVHSISV